MQIHERVFSRAIRFTWIGYSLLAGCDAFHALDRTVAQRPPLRISHGIVRFIGRDGYLGMCVRYLSHRRVAAGWQPLVFYTSMHHTPCFLGCVICITRRTPLDIAQCL